MDEKQLVNREEAARRLGIRSRTIYALVRAGKIPAVKVGRVWKFDPQQLLEWLQSQTTSEHEPAPDTIATPPVRSEELSGASLDNRLLGWLVAEQRQTNRLLVKLLNRGGGR